MGFQDREYYRDATRGSGFFTGESPAVKTIILVNVIVYLGQLFHLIPTEHFAARAADIFEHYRIWELLTSAFLHDPDNKFHIFFNMLVLWFVGREMESLYGTREFTWFYLSAAVLSCLIWSLVEYFAPARFSGSFYLGASGAIMGVFVLYTLYNPMREVLLFFVLPMPMWLVLVFYLGGDFVGIIQRNSGIEAGAVAFAGHLGGAAYGFLYKFFDLRISRLWSYRPRKPRLRLISAEPRLRVAPLTKRGAGRTQPSSGGQTSAPRAKAGETFEHFEARLDAVLAKIHDQGRDSLTAEDQSILDEASRRARDKRTDHH
ncbi:MAG: rhomboid family intramembrane serine protease [Isosphaeraceae bacterium]